MEMVTFRVQEDLAESGSRACMKAALEAALAEDAHLLVIEVREMPGWLARDFGKLEQCLSVADCRMEIADVPFVVG